MASAHGHDSTQGVLLPQVGHMAEVALEYAGERGHLVLEELWRARPFRV